MKKHQNALNYAREHHQDFLNQLIDLLAIESVSTDPNRKSSILAAAAWLAQKLSSFGMDVVTTYPTPLHPVVYASKIVNASLPTVLVYGHYDVQPEDPVHLWQSHPYQAQIRDGKLYARGAADMKGQIMAGLAAIESILAVDELPVNLKFIYEGEEEIGSPSIKQFMENHREELKADIVLNLDAGMIAADIPTITYALRGLAYFELTVTGPATDLHSGIFGGIIHNPAQVLCEIIAGMKDEYNRITLPGFYDDVLPLTQLDKDELARMPQTEEILLKQTGAPALRGESGFTLMEQNSARPTLDINGLYSGFTGEGAKTVIPSWAMAKFSMRTVPNQRPERIEAQVKQYLQEKMPNTVTWKLKTFTGGFPSYCDPENPASKAMAAAMAEVWNTTPVLKREGASIPIVNEMQEILGLDSVLSGFALPDDNMHAPNEKLDISIWEKGIESILIFLYNLASNQ